jgi:hypothetical protein
MSITFLPHVNDLDITLLNCPHQALVHVVVDLILQPLQPPDRPDWKHHLWLQGNVSQ